MALRGTATLTVPSGGGPGETELVGDDKVTINISQKTYSNTVTTITQFDQVWLHADNLGEFDTASDERDQRLIYFWSTGKTGNFSTPQNLLPAHKSKRYAHGPFIAVCYDEPGVYTITLYVWEPSSGKFSTRTAFLTVLDAGDVYAGSQTICINRFGDGNFAGAPVGAQTYNLDADNVFDAAIFDATYQGSKKRYLLKGGSEFIFNQEWGDASDMPDGTMIGSYGTGRAKIVNTSAHGDPFNLGAMTFSTPKRILLNNLEAEGDFNAETNSGGPTWFFETNHNIQVVMHNVKVTNYNALIYMFRDNGNSTQSANQAHFNEVELSVVGGQYPVLGGTYDHADARVAFTGCMLLRDPRSLFEEGFSGDPWNGDYRAIIRLNAHREIYFQANDIYHNAGNQPALKLAENLGYQNARINMHCNTIECANGFLIRYAGGVYNNNNKFLFRQNICIGGTPQTGELAFTSSSMILVGGAQSSCDANLAISLDTVGDEDGRLRGLFDYGSGSSDVNLCRNNTLVSYRDLSQNNGLPDGITRITGTTVTEYDNLEHYPDMSVTTYAPLEDGPSGVALFTSRNTGRNFITGGVGWDTDWGSSPSEIYSFQPEAGSSAIGGGSSNSYPYPIDAQTEADFRPSGSEYRGCW